MAGKYNAFMFSVPNLPKPIYDRLKAIGTKFELSNQQMVILGVLAIRHLGSSSPGDQAALKRLVQKVNGMEALSLDD